MNRVGGELTLTALPHHRTCGSAYGGSTSTLEVLLRIEQREQPHAREEGGRKSEIHVGCPCIAPGTSPIHRTLPGTVAVQPQLQKLALTGWGPFPLPPQQAS